MSVFLCIETKMENCNKEGLNQNEKEKEKIRILIVKDHREGSQSESTESTEAVVLEHTHKNRTFRNLSKEIYYYAVIMAHDEKTLEEAV